MSSRGYDFWAKLNPFHPLLAHSADVAAVFRELVAEGSPLARAFAAAAGIDTLTGYQRAQLVFLAALHDMGKVGHGFQVSGGPGSSSNFSEFRGHVTVLLDSASVPAVAVRLGSIVERSGWSEDDGIEMLISAICHHGRPHAPQPRAAGVMARNWSLDESSERDPLAEMDRLIDWASRWSEIEDFEGAGEPLPVTPALTHLFAGTLMLADWMGSEEEDSRFPHLGGPLTDPAEYWTHVCDRAARICSRRGLRNIASLPELDASRIYPELWPGVFDGRTQPTALQRAVADMPLPAAGGRVLIESETGSGKTEAVLALYARLRARGVVGGLMFALPTRATSTAMFRRVAHAVARLYPGDVRPPTVLAMGGAGVRETEADILADADPRVYPDEEDRLIASWATERSKKYLAGEVVVGTVDQALLAALAVKHAALRLAPLSRHLLVVDEVHSYDRYMSTVLNTLLDAHGAVGGVSVLMSATLADRERSRYAGRDDYLYDDSLASAETRPYPMVATRSAGSVEWSPIALEDDGPTTPPKPVSWSLATEADVGIEAAVAAAQGGARVCMLRNTVRGARAVLRALVKRGHQNLIWRPEGVDFPVAYHSRYIAADREFLDTAVLDTFGRSGRAPSSGILVATQVVEQSLDVDFDFMVTDMAPMDVLLQRIGRLHRHPERQRPKVASAPRVIVLAPDGGFEPLLTAKSKRRDGWGSVYRSFSALELTRRVIEDRQQIVIPRDNRPLIEAVYHPESERELTGGDRASAQQWIHAIDVEEKGLDIAAEGIAFKSTIDFGVNYCSHQNAEERYSGTGAKQERAIRTRLGTADIRVETPGGITPTIATTADCPATEVGIPLWLFRDAADVDLRDLKGTDRTEGLDHTEFTVPGAGRVRYDRAGWWWPSDTPDG